MKSFLIRHWKGIGYGLLLSLLLVVLFSLFDVTDWVYERLTKGLSAPNQLEIAKFKATLIGGALLAIQLVFFGWRAVSADKTAKTLQQNAELTEKGNIAERFKNAIEHLGSPSEFIRLGGIYALNRIAMDNDRYRENVFEILCTFIRMETTGTNYNLSKVDEIQSIVNLLFKSDDADIYKDFRAVLDGANLQGVEWDGVNLRGALLRDADLRGVAFIESDLSDAQLQYSNLESAKFREVNLKKAELWRSNLQKASFQGSNLEGALLHRANLKHARFSGTKLKEAKFWNADLQDVSFFGVDFQNTNFQYANLIDIEIKEIDKLLEELLKAETLHNAKLPNELKLRIEERDPKLLDVYTKPIVLPYPVAEPDMPKEKTAGYVIAMLQ